MTAAIFGLLGVFVGALITAGSNYYLALRHERVEREKDDHAHAIAVKRAARLIEQELGLAESVADVAIDTRRWADVKLSTNAWQEYCPVIASELSTADWDAISSAFIFMGLIESARAEHVEPVSERSASQIAIFVKAVKGGLAAIHPLV